MEGRREVSIIPHRPVPSSDLKHYGRLFFRRSVSTFLQMVVVTKPVHFVRLTDSFIILSAKLLKTRSFRAS